MNCYENIFSQCVVALQKNHSIHRYILKKRPKFDNETFTELLWRECRLTISNETLVCAWPPLRSLWYFEQGDYMQNTELMIPCKLFLACLYYSISEKDEPAEFDILASWLMAPHAESPPRCCRIASVSHTPAIESASEEKGGREKGREEGQEEGQEVCTKKRRQWATQGSKEAIAPTEKKVKGAPSKEKVVVARTGDTHTHTGLLDYIS